MQSFNVLQQRLNRKSVTPKLSRSSRRICASTTSWPRAARTCAPLPFAERRARLEAFVARLDDPRIDLSPLVPFATWDELAAPAPIRPRRAPGADAEAVEG